MPYLLSMDLLAHEHNCLNMIHLCLRFAGKLRHKQSFGLLLPYSIKWDSVSIKYDIVSLFKYSFKLMKSITYRIYHPVGYKYLPWKTVFWTTEHRSYWNEQTNLYQLHQDGRHGLAHGDLRRGWWAIEDDVWIRPEPVYFGCMHRVDNSFYCQTKNKSLKLMFAVWIESKHSITYVPLISSMLIVPTMLAHDDTLTIRELRSCVPAALSCGINRCVNRKWPR